MKVCEKVETKRETTYDEVAQELLREFQVDDPDIDDKNIRRRVYDALNVLMATGIITKSEKKIIWSGASDIASIDTQALEQEKLSTIEERNRKREELRELENLEHVYKTLSLRNIQIPTYNSSPHEERIYLPFIVVLTSNTTQILCEVDNSRTSYFFEFSQPFEIHDECEIFRGMGLMKPKRVAETN